MLEVDHPPRWEGKVALFISCSRLNVLECSESRVEGGFLSGVGHCQKG